jgi:hypothetical protein
MFCNVQDSNVPDRTGAETEKRALYLGAGSREAETEKLGDVPKFQSTWFFGTARHANRGEGVETTYIPFLNRQASWSRCKRLQLACCVIGVLFLNTLLHNGAAVAVGGAW